MRTTCLPADFQLCIENTKKSAQFSSFLQDAIAIHLLSNTILPGVLFFLLLNLTYATFHFEPLCHRKKIPSKSFVLYSHSNSILFTTIAKQEASAYFHISYCLFHSESKKIHFRIQIDLQLNFIQIIRSSFFLPPALNYCKGEDRLVFPNNHFKTSVTAATLLQRARCCSARKVVLCFSLFHFLSFPSFLSTSTIFRFLSSDSLTLHPVFVHKSPLESVFVSFFSAINFFFESIEYTTLTVHCR